MGKKNPGDKEEIDIEYYWHKILDVVGGVLVGIYILILVLLSIPFNLFMLSRYYLEDCRRFRLTEFQAIKSLWKQIYR